MPIRQEILFTPTAKWSMAWGVQVCDMCFRAGPHCSYNFIHARCPVEHSVTVYYAIHIAELTAQHSPGQVAAVKPPCGEGCRNSCYDRQE